MQAPYRFEVKVPFRLHEEVLRQCLNKHFEMIFMRAVKDARQGYLLLPRTAGRLGYVVLSLQGPVSGKGKPVWALLRQAVRKLQFPHGKRQGKTSNGNDRHGAIRHGRRKEMSGLVFLAPGGHSNGLLHRPSGALNNRHHWQGMCFTCSGESPVWNRHGAPKILSILTHTSYSGPTCSA